VGDGYLAIASDPTELRREVWRLHELAERAGRDPSTLTVALLDGIVVTERPLGHDRSPLSGTPPQIVDGLRAYADAGLDHLVASLRSHGRRTFSATTDAIDVVVAEVLPHL
jgi:alkanesulfonate monooxygenase SsuD/methylene tetrahydromethanopterin reductase-like flavin-dependent oxidoreductase (luciferase family)